MLLYSKMWNNCNNRALVREIWKTDICQMEIFDGEILNVVLSGWEFTPPPQLILVLHWFYLGYICPMWPSRGYWLIKNPKWTCIWPYIKQAQNKRRKVKLQYGANSGLLSYTEHVLWNWRYLKKNVQSTKLGTVFSLSTISAVVIVLIWRRASF